MIPTEYFARLEMSSVRVDRFQEVVKFYEEVLPSPIEQVFLSSIIDQEGQDVPESLWVFTKEHICEAHNVMTEDHFDLTPKARIGLLEVKKFDYKPGEDTLKSSRLTVQYSIRSFGVSGILKAAGMNCSYLYEIYLSHLVPLTMPTE